MGNKKLEKLGDKLYIVCMSSVETVVHNRINFQSFPFTSSLEDEKRQFTKVVMLLTSLRIEFDRKIVT